MTLSWFCFLADVTLFEQQQRLLSNSSVSAAAAGAFHSPHALSANSWSIQQLYGLYHPYERSALGADFYSFLENGTFNFTEMGNATQNFTSGDDENCMGMQQVFIAVAIVVMIFFTILGNFGVIAAVCVYRRMQTFTNMLLVSLASADLLVGSLIMPPAMLYLLRDQWPFSPFVCRLWATLDVLLCTASILNLCVISLDRYFAITWPLKYIRKRTKCLATMLILCVWFVSGVISSPPWLIPDWGFEDRKNHCAYVKTLSYRIYSAAGSFYFPLLIMLFVYYKILRVANEREQLIVKTGAKMSVGGVGTQSKEFCRQRTSDRLTMSEPGGRGGAVSLNNSLYSPRKITQYSDIRSDDAMISTCVDSTKAAIPQRLPMHLDEISQQNDTFTDGDLCQTAKAMYQSRNGRQGNLVSFAREYYKHSKPNKDKETKTVYLRERKALKTIGIIVVGFITCWLPFFVLYVLESACRKETCDVPPILEAIFLWLGYSNSVLNPVIYTLYNQDFRRCFRDMLGCGCCRQRMNRRMSVRRLQSKTHIV